MSNIDPQSSIDAYTRLIGYAGSTGAHMHICHFNATSLQDARAFGPRGFVKCSEGNGVAAMTGKIEDSAQSHHRSRHKDSHLK